MDSAKRPIDNDTMLLLMQLADGELDGPDHADLRARAERLVAEDTGAARVVSRMLTLSSITREAALARVPEGFDVAAAVLERVDALPKSSVVPLAPRRENARPRLDRRRAALVAGLAIAAAALVYSRVAREPDVARTTPPVEGDRSGVVVEEKQELASVGKGSVDVNAVESPQHVSVFVLPESNASAASVVVWIDDPSGSE
jgi:hypothetical protein